MCCLTKHEDTVPISLRTFQFARQQPQFCAALMHTPQSFSEFGIPSAQRQNHMPPNNQSVEEDHDHGDWLRVR